MHYIVLINRIITVGPCCPIQVRHEEPFRICGDLSTCVIAEEVICPSCTGFLLLSSTEEIVGKYVSQSAAGGLS